MTRMLAWTQPLGRYLAPRVERLNEVLSDLSGQVRRAIVTRVAECVATVVSETVEEVMAALTTRPPPSSSFNDLAVPMFNNDKSRRLSSRGLADSTSARMRRWNDGADEGQRFGSSRSGQFDDSGYRQDPEGNNELDDDAIDTNTRQDTAVSSQGARSRSPLIQEALLLGLQASAWWLARRRQATLLMTLAVGASAGTLVLLGSSLLLPGITTVRSLLSLSL